jgi:GAF domain-containing protein
VDIAGPTFSDGIETLGGLSVLARALHVKNGELQPTLDAIVKAAVAGMPHAQHAGLVLVVKGELIPQAVTGMPPHELDLQQQKTKSGPCIDAAERQAVNIVADTSDEVQWPAFCEEAVRLGVGSMLCMPLWVDERTLGTLSMYAERPHAFDDHDEQILNLFATLAATALSGALLATQLQAALSNRDVIGQAKGILMERHRITADRAFAMLAQASQNQNKRLFTVAEAFVNTGELPGTSG